MRDLRLPVWSVYLLSVFPIWTLTVGTFSPSQMGWALVAGIATLPLVRRIIDLHASIGVLRMLRRAGGLVVAYFWLFVPDAVRSTLDMSWRLLRPSIPLRPGIVAVDVPLGDPVEILFLINHITLTPGQFVVDYDLQRGRLYVHAVDASDPVRIRRGIQDLHRRGRRLIG